MKYTAKYLDIYFRFGVILKILTDKKMNGYICCVERKIRIEVMMYYGTTY